MSEFSDGFEFEADDMMDNILAESSISPTLTPFHGLGTNEPASDCFQSLDDGGPSLARMKRCGLHRAEAFEL
jgi:hypothetical protein